MRVIAQSRGPVVPPARVPTRPDSRTRTPPAGRPYCADGRNHRVRQPPRWCGGGATQRNVPDSRSVTPLWVCTCRTWGKSPDFGPRDKIVVVSDRAYVYEPVPGPGTAIPVLIHSSISDLGVSLIFPSLLCGEVFDITRERGTA